MNEPELAAIVATIDIYLNEPRMNEEELTAIVATIDIGTSEQQMSERELAAIVAVINVYLDMPHLNEEPGSVHEYALRRASDTQKSLSAWREITGMPNALHAKQWQGGRYCWLTPLWNLAEKASRLTRMIN